MKISTFVEAAEAVLDTPSASPKAFRESMDPGGTNHRFMPEIMATAKLMAAVESGSMLARQKLIEAISTSDLIAWSTGTIIDRRIMDAYDAIKKQWPKFLTRTTVKDFKPASLAAVNLPTQVFYDVPEGAEYPMAKGPNLKESFISVKKTGIRYGWTWEARINQDIEQLMAVVNAFPQMATDTEDDRGLRLMANLDTGAPNTAFFNTTNNNLGHLTLTVENLARVIAFLSQKRDPNAGGIIPAGPLQLVVGPALQPTAERILSAKTIRTVNGGTTIEENNPVAGKVQLAVNERLIGSAWFVMPVPRSAGAKPAYAPFWMAFLTGYETPDYRYLNDQGRAIGGGELGPDAGSFREDTIWYRARHIMGAAHGDPTLTYGSDNTGTGAEPTGMPASV